MQYWVVSFSLEDSHVVNALTQEEVVSHPLATFRVHYKELRHKYTDTDSEVRSQLKDNRLMPDPRVLVNPNTNVDVLWQSLQSKGSQIDRESLEERLELARLLASTSPEILQDRIHEYERINGLSDEDLIREIRSDLDKKKNYSPSRIPSLSRLDLEIGLNQAGYITGYKGYESLEETLNELYKSWERIRNSSKKVNTMRELSMTFDEIFEE